MRALVHPEECSAPQTVVVDCSEPKTVVAEMTLAYCRGHRHHLGCQRQDVPIGPAVSTPLRWLSGVTHIPGLPNKELLQRAPWKKQGRQIEHEVSQ
mmetsp:Transcript_45142/g.89470  ORF Transcript_45142/g.89470 Transcript_45142/m.89470 type:complete len:96 (-) Transcript_45142:360-647(-)